MNETRTSLIAEYLPYPRQLAQLDPRPRSFNLGSAGNVRWKHVLVLESGRRIGQAQEVCRKKRFSTEKDIRLPVLPFVCSIVHLTHRISFSRPHSYLLKVFRSRTRFLYSLLFSDISYILLLFVSRKGFVLWGNLGLDPLRLTT